MMTDSINAAAQELEVWLADPHELGRKPAKVEYVNFFEDNGIRCLIFRYRKSLFASGFSVLSAIPAPLVRCGSIVQKPPARMPKPFWIP